MEIKAKRGDLLATLYWTQSIVERRNTMPILANVMIEAHKSGIRITATDLEVGVRGSVEGEVVKEGTVLGFDLVVWPLAPLYSVAKSLTDVYTTLRKEGSTLSILDRLMPFDEFNGIVGLNEKYMLDAKFKT
jgi:DNA polymerase-3 subunit beta